MSTTRKGLFGEGQLKSEEKSERASLHHQVAAVQVEAHSEGGVQLLEGTSQPRGGCQPEEEIRLVQRGDRQKRGNSSLPNPTPKYFHPVTPV